MTKPTSILTEADLKRTLSRLEIARVTDMLSLMALGITALVTLFLIARYPTSFFLIALPALFLILLFGSAYIAALVYKTRHPGDYYTVGYADMLKLMEQIAPYPDIQEELRPYLLVRECLTGDEYLHFSILVQSRLRSQLYRQLSQEVDTFLHKEAC